MDIRIKGNYIYIYIINGDWRTLPDHRHVFRDSAVLPKS